MEPSRAVPATGYTYRMVARHPRIQVPRDPELDRAIARGQALLGPGAPASQVVRQLALRGVEALEAEAVSSDRGRDFLVAVADGTAGLGSDSLRTVRDRAWR
jgi:hypothetical protein